jgi:hypothetical protein
MTREDAIEILRGAIKKPNTKDGYLGQAFDMAIEALEQTRWIPVSERLPKDEGEYLVTFKLPFMNFIEVCTFNKAGWNKVGYDEVIAWMPLPSSYQGGESDAKQ